MNEGAYFYPSLYDHFDTLGDHLAWFISELFFGQKFYPLLAMLFGAGIVLMARAVESAEGRPAAVHYRRMAGLFVIGLLHAHLLWHGDVLFKYALCGSLAYPLHRKGPGVLLLFSIVSLLVALVPWSSIPLSDALYDLDAYRESGRDEVAIFQEPWATQFEMRTWLARRSQTAGYVIDFHALGMMFLGMFLLKTGRLGDPGDMSGLRKGAVCACLVGWLITMIGLCYWWSTGFAIMRSWFIMNLWLFAGGIITSLGYLAAIRLWVRRDSIPRVLSILESIGRTALSNYLLQSLIASFIFHGQGFGLIGTFGRGAQLLFVPAIWSVQILLTLAWLEHHSQGPVEALLRKLTRRPAKPAEQVEVA